MMEMYPSNQKKKERCNDDPGPNHADPARQPQPQAPNDPQGSDPKGCDPWKLKLPLKPEVNGIGVSSDSKNSSNSSSPQQRRYSLQMFSSQGLCAC